jgi:hypothetical protein
MAIKFLAFNSIANTLVNVASSGADIMLLGTGTNAGQYPQTAAGFTAGRTSTSVLNVGADQSVSVPYRTFAILPNGDAAQRIRIDRSSGTFSCGFITYADGGTYHSGGERIIDADGTTVLFTRTNVDRNNDPSPARYWWTDMSGNATAADPGTTVTTTGGHFFIELRGLPSFGGKLSAFWFDDGVGGTTTELGLRVTAGAATVDLAPLPLRTGGGGGDVGTTYLAAKWGTATGNSEAAIGDGGLFTNLYSPGNWEQSLRVITSATAPAPLARTPNVLRIQQLGSTVNGTVERTNVLPLNASYYGQMFILNGGDTQVMNHPLTQNLIGGFMTIPLGWTGRASNFTPFLRVQYDGTGAAQSYPRLVWSIGTPGSGATASLANNTWYRYRWYVETVTPGAVTTYRIYPEIRSYNNANPTDIGTLLYDANSYFQQDTDGSPGQSLQAYYNGGGVFGIPDPALARNIAFGQEGPEGASNTGAYFYAGDWTLTSDGFPD